MKNIWNFLISIIRKDYEKIFAKKHIVFAINITPDFKLNDWTHWKQIYPILDSLITLQNLQTECFIRTFQAFEFENKWLGFGRMKWNFENNKKCVQKYQSKEFLDKKLFFCNTEIWTPDWNHYYNTGEPPKIFINVKSELKSNGYVIALDKRFYNKNKKTIDFFISEIVRLTPDSELNSTERWWKPMFKNEIPKMVMLIR